MPKPSPPAPKIWYESDGSLFYQQSITGGQVTAISNFYCVRTNWDTSYGFSASDEWRIGLVFPLRRDVVGMYLCMQYGEYFGPIVVRTSTNTTNGADGTWSVRTSSFPIAPDVLNVKTSYRDYVVAVSYPGIKGITIEAAGNALGTTAAVAGWHLYGDVSSGERVDWLEFWMPTDASRIGPGHFNFGNIQRLRSGQVAFRVKNTSSGKTANSITVSSDALTSPTPPLTTNTLFSLDGSTYARSINIGNLAPGAVSGVLHCRTTPADGIEAWYWRQRCYASAASFT